MNISVNLLEMNNEYIATCPELDINCYGITRNDAIRRLKEVVQFYISSAKELGFDVETFETVTIEGESVELWQNASTERYEIPNLIN